MRSRDFRPSSRRDGAASKPSNWLNTVRPFAPVRPAPPPAQVQRAVDPETEPEEDESGGTVVQRTVDPNLAAETRVEVTAEKYKQKYRAEAIVVRRSRQQDHLVVRYEHIPTPDGADGFRFHIDDLNLVGAQEEENEPAEFEGAANEADRELLETAMIGVYNRAKGKRVYIWKIGADYTDKICHHYAFGGLRGDYKEFDITKLAQTLDAFYDYQGQIIPAFADHDGETLDVGGKIADVGGQTAFPVRMLDDMAHSTRLEDGRWWHKFNGLPFLVSVEGDDNLGYPLTASFTVLSAARPAGAAGSFVVPG